MKKKKVKPAAKKAASFGEVLGKSDQIFSRDGKGGSVIIVNFDNDKNFYQLDGVAVEFWNLINGARSVDQICKIITRKYTPPQQALNRGVQALLKDLKKHKLVVTKKA